ARTGSPVMVAPHQVADACRPPVSPLLVSSPPMIGSARHTALLAAALGVLALAALTVGSDAPSYAGDFLLPRGVPATSSGPPSGSRLIFSDDFHEGTLDPSKWITCYPWASPKGCTNPATRELQWYNPAGVSVSDGAVHLIARHQSVTEDGHRYAFTS